MLPNTEEVAAQDFPDVFIRVAAVFESFCDVRIILNASDPNRRGSAGIHVCAKADMIHACDFYSMVDVIQDIFNGRKIFHWPVLSSAEMFESDTKLKVFNRGGFLNQGCPIA